MPATYAGAGLRCRSSIRPRIFWNKLLNTATSSNWKVTYLPWRTTLAPIFTNFSRSVVSDQCSTSFGKAESPLMAKKRSSDGVSARDQTYSVQLPDCADPNLQIVQDSVPETVYPAMDLEFLAIPPSVLND